MRMVSLGDARIDIQRPEWAGIGPAAVLHAQDRFRLEPTSQRPHRNGLSWSAADAV